MHDTGELDNHGNVEGEECEVVVDEVNHVIGSINLGGKLSQDACEDDHTKSNIQEDELDTIGKAEYINRRV